MFIVDVSPCTPPGKVDLLRSVNNVEPGPIIPHSIALGKLYTRIIQDLRIFVGNRLSCVSGVWARLIKLRVYYNAAPILSGEVTFRKERDPDSESA